MAGGTNRWNQVSAGGGLTMPNLYGAHRMAQDAADTFTGFTDKLAANRAAIQEQEETDLTNRAIAQALGMNDRDNFMDQRNANMAALDPRVNQALVAKAYQDRMDKLNTRYTQSLDDTNQSVINQNQQGVIDSELALRTAQAANQRASAAATQYSTNEQKRLSELTEADRLATNELVRYMSNYMDSGEMLDDGDLFALGRQHANFKEFTPTAMSAARKIMEERMGLTPEEKTRQTAEQGGIKHKQAIELQELKNQGGVDKAAEQNKFKAYGGRGGSGKGGVPGPNPDASKATEKATDEDVNYWVDLQRSAYRGKGISPAMFSQALLENTDPQSMAISRNALTQQLDRMALQLEAERQSRNNKNQLYTTQSYPVR